MARNGLYRWCDNCGTYVELEKRSMTSPALADGLKEAGVSREHLENEFYSYMEEAVGYHNLIHTLTQRYIKDHSANAAQKAVITVTIQLLTKMRDSLRDNALSKYEAIYALDSVRS